jgi:molybdate transport system substrate-binding protein
VLLVAGCKHSEPAAANQCSLTVFAASSLTDLADIVGQAFTKDNPACTVTHNVGASNKLGLQIEAGAQADVFLSAAQAPVDRLTTSLEVATGSRVTLFSNRLALVSHPASSLTLGDICGLATARFRYLAIGQPDAVPAGMYAKEYLSKLDCPGARPLWNAVKDRLLPMPNARAVLSVIEEQSDLIGIVYHTDALGSKRVKTQLVINGAGAPRIEYFGIRIGSSERSKLADAYLRLFFTPRVRAAIKSMGFVSGES